MVTTVDVEDAKKNLTGLLDVVTSGGEVLICRDDAPIAGLVSASAQPFSERIAGLHRGSMLPSTDFDAPLPDEFWSGQG